MGCLSCIGDCIYKFYNLVHVRFFWSNYSDLTRPGPPNGGLVRKIPGYYRKFQVGETLFHLARYVYKKQCWEEVRNHKVFCFHFARYHT